MPKDDDLQKHTLNLRKGDYEKIKDFFPDLHASQVIRMVISKYVDSLEGDSTPVNVKVQL